MHNALPLAATAATQRTHASPSLLNVPGSHGRHCVRDSEGAEPGEHAGMYTDSAAVSAADNDRVTPLALRQEMDAV